MDIPSMRMNSASANNAIVQGSALTNGTGRIAKRIANNPAAAIHGATPRRIATVNAPMASAYGVNRTGGAVNALTGTTCFLKKQHEHERHHNQHEQLGERHHGHELYRREARLLLRQ